MKGQMKKSAPNMKKSASNMKKNKGESRPPRMKAKKEGRQAVRATLKSSGKKPSNYKTKVKVKKKK